MEFIDTRRLPRAAALLSSCAMLAMAVPAMSQEATSSAAGEEPTGAIIVTGTRSQGTSPTESLSPVSVVGAESLTQQAAPTLTDALTNIAPSINTQRFPIADGTAFVRPVSLRNLAPDQTLVLVNSVRRHRSALVNLQTEPFGTVNQGAQAVDFSLIPSIAIERLEVLRDGASAQYGSDAIAGVVNIILREDAGVHLTAQYGEAYEGDGENYSIAGNVGFDLSDRGFISLSLEYVDSQITSRGSARPDAAAVADEVGADLVPFNGLGQRWGDPDIESLRGFLNFGFDIADGTELYAHASFADSTSFSGFFYRTPFGVDGVGPRGTLCQCTDGVPNDTDQAVVDAILAAGLNPADYLTASATSPSGYVNLNPIWTEFPGGYNPTFGADIKDMEVVAGIRGEFGSDISWDLSGRYGENELSYFLRNSINPSLGRLSPLTFRPGDLKQKETGVNFDVVIPIEAGMAQPVNIALGAEWRREEYVIGAGDPASYESGPTAGIFGVGSDGFQGDSPAAAGSFARNSYAGYIDLEAEVTDGLTLGAAARFEDFDDFGSTFNWKLSGRFEVTPDFAVRSTISTGFRAPTPGQINTLDVTTTSDSSGNLVPLGTFPVNSVVAQTLGAEPLDAEDSTNFTAGLVYSGPGGLELTLDFYQIDVDDRIALISQAVTPGSPEDAALIAAGFPGLGSASFFANAFDSRVRGIEFGANKRFDLGSGDLTLDFKYSWNDQKIRAVRFASVNPELLYDYENQLPSNRAVLTGDFEFGRFGATARASYYDGWEDLTFGELNSFGSEILVDLEVRADITENIGVAVGAQNLFDNYPDDEQNSVLRFLGATRPISSPFGFNGGSWYARLKVDF